MKYSRRLYLIGMIFVINIWFLTGCSSSGQAEELTKPIAETEQSMTETSVTGVHSKDNDAETGTVSGSGDNKVETAAASDSKDSENTTGPDMEDREAERMGPVFADMDWSEYFGSLNGSAVFYDAVQNQYSVYNQELLNERRSPCSTFKIISSLIGLENGIIQTGNSVRTWSGEKFWNEKWNKDIGFEDAFKASCVWYYRELIDEMGPEMIQDELERLQYGNMDTSDWEGRLNNNNNNRALTGFWIESSLKISPLEQVQVMERIFGEDAIYKIESTAALKQVMMVTDYETENVIYGKTGLGKVSGIVVDSWFTGFFDNQGRNIYFCVYLGETEGEEVSSAKAKEIAVRVIEDNYPIIKDS